MSPEKQRIAIAEACGWKLIRISSALGDSRPVGVPPTRLVHEEILPNYPGDLNAMQSAFARRSYAEQTDIVEFLVMKKPTSTPAMAIAFSTAEDWAEAFLKTQSN